MANTFIKGPIAGEHIAFTLGGGATTQSCNGITDATGTAVCTIPAVSQPLSPMSVAVNYAGNGYYLAASASASVLVVAVKLSPKRISLDSDDDSRWVRVLLRGRQARRTLVPTAPWHFALVVPGGAPVPVVDITHLDTDDDERDEALKLKFDGRAWKQSSKSAGNQSWRARACAGIATPVRVDSLACASSLHRDPRRRRRRPSP